MYRGFLKDINKDLNKTSLSFDQKKISKSKRLRENRVIVHFFFNIFVPMTVFSLLGIFSPYVYTLMPVYQSGSCWTHFFQQGLVPPNENHCLLLHINIYVFIVVNWVFLSSLVLIYWKIRNIRNELNIKKEILFVMFAWGFFSLLYYSLNVLLRAFIHSDLSDPYQDTMAKFYTSCFLFAIVLSRNLFTLLAQTYFSLKMLFVHPERNYPLLYEGKLIAMDFDLILDTEEPFDRFYDFIQVYSPFNQVYIEVFALVRTLEKGVEELNDEGQELTKNQYVKVAQELQAIQKNINDVIDANYQTHFHKRNNSVQDDEDYEE